MRYTGRNTKAIVKWAGEHVTEIPGALLIDDRVARPGCWVYEAFDFGDEGIRVFGIIEGRSFDSFWERVDG